MSQTTAVGALSDELKSAVIAAVETHAANALAEANRVKAAIQADLPGVQSTAVSIETLVKAEYEKLKGDVISIMPTWMKIAVVVVTCVVAGLTVHALHYF